jgi:hypothetical protein
MSAPERVVTFHQIRRTSLWQMTIPSAVGRQNIPIDWRSVSFSQVNRYPLRLGLSCWMYSTRTYHSLSPPKCGCLPFKDSEFDGIGLPGPRPPFPSDCMMISHRSWEVYSNRSTSTRIHDPLTPRLSLYSHVQWGASVQIHHYVPILFMCQ